MNHEAILDVVTGELAAITGRPRERFSADTALIGAHGIKSRELVELLLFLEDWASDTLGIEFDWTSDQALSETHSNYRTVGTLVELMGSLAKGQ